MGSEGSRGYVVHLPADAVSIGNSEARRQLINGYQGAQ